MELTRTDPEAVAVRRLLVVTATMALARFKVRYLDFKLSYLWTIARPLALFGVLYVFSTTLTSLDRGVDHYAIYLLTAVVLWTFFAEATMSGLRALVDQRPILRTLPVPRASVPLSVGLTALFDLFMTLIPVFVLALASGVYPRLSWLELPLLLAILGMLAVGFSLLLSALYIHLRDLDRIWLVLTQAFFYATPIFYVATSLSERAAELLLLVNPLAALFTEMRHAFVDPTAPSAAEVIGGAPRLAIPLAIVVAVLALGVVVFRRLSPRAVENL